MFETAEPVTICDQFIFLRSSKLEPKVFRKSFYITFYCLVKHFCINPIQLCQVSIYHYLFIS